MTLLVMNEHDFFLSIVMYCLLAKFKVYVKQKFPLFFFVVTVSQIVVLQIDKLYTAVKSFKLTFRTVVLRWSE